jgi:hypothetical protein
MVLLWGQVSGAAFSATGVGGGIDSPAQADRLKAAANTSKEDLENMSPPELIKVMEEIFSENERKGKVRRRIGYISNA